MFENFSCHSLDILYRANLPPPQKNLLGLGVVVGGWSLAAYFVTWFLNQGWRFVLEIWLFVCAYIVLAGKEEMQRKRGKKE